MNARTWIAAGLAAVGLALATASDAEAAPRRRFRHQWQRLQEGRRHDDLSDSEFRHLRNNQRRIFRDYRRDRRDGCGLSGYERQRLDRRMDRQSRMIYRKRNNRWRD